MPKPTVKDAELLIALERLKFSPPLDEAFAWFARELAEVPAMSPLEFKTKYPRGSEGLLNTQRIGQFYETMGTIAKHGLINLDVLFDRYGVYPFWEKLSVRVEDDRAEHPEVGLVWGENFEWLAKKNEAWVKKHASELKRKVK